AYYLRSRHDFRECRRPLDLFFFLSSRRRHTSFSRDWSSDVCSSDLLGMNEIHVVQKGEIVFVDHPKYYEKALNCNATVVLINKKVECPEGKALLISDDPFRDFNKLTLFFQPFMKSQLAISSTAIIGEDTVIQPNCFIGNNVVIGKNCIIHSN